MYVCGPIIWAEADTQNPTSPSTYAILKFTFGVFLTRTMKPGGKQG